MVSEYEIALGMVAPMYNLVLAAIVFYLFLKLFSLPNRLVYVKPWKVLFAAFLVYLVEEIFTVFRKIGVANIPTIFNGLFEMIIISLFIYMLFLQKEYVKERVKIIKVARKKSKKKKKR